jgi:hypothetical protein
MSTLKGNMVAKTSCITFIDVLLYFGSYQGGDFRCVISFAPRDCSYIFWLSACLGLSCFTLLATANLGTNGHQSGNSGNPNPLSGALLYLIFS